MSLRTEVKNIVKNGMTVTIFNSGVKIKGKVIKMNLANPMDASIVIDSTKDENVVRHIIPINNSIIVGVELENEISENEISENVAEISYDLMEVSDLISLCNKREIFIRKGMNKKQIINALKYYDEEHAKIIKKKKKKHRK